MNFPIKVGDDILVRMRVDYVGKDIWNNCTIPGVVGHWSVPNVAITGHIPAPPKSFEIGDKVKLKNTCSDLIYTIEAIRDKYIWCKYIYQNSNEESYLTYLKEDLEYA